MFVSPQGMKYYSAFHFNFFCSKNTTEYEAFIHGLHWARKRGIKNLQVFGDSELVANQFEGWNATKNDLLNNYKNRVWDLIEYFEAFGINSILREKNAASEILAAIGVEFDVVESIKSERS